MLKAEMAIAAVGTKPLCELEAKLRKSQEKAGTLKGELGRLWQGCQPGALLPKELAKNQALKMELAEL